MARIIAPVAMAGKRDCPESERASCAAARVSVDLPAGAFGFYVVPAWLARGQPGPSQLKPPVEPGQVRKPAPVGEYGK